MSEKLTKLVSKEDLHDVLAALAADPGRNAWAIQDLKIWPERTSLYYVGETLDRGEFTYLLVTGHPGAQTPKTIVMSGDADRAPELLEFLPPSPWLLRESPASMLKVVEPNFPTGKAYLEDRMQVGRDTFKPASKTVTIRRLTSEDAAALADLKGAPPQAANGFIPWIKGAHLFGAWEGSSLAAIASTFVTVPEVWELIGIETKPVYRGKGLGTQVTSALTEIALEHAPVVTLTVLKENDPAQRMYSKLGFEHCEDRVWFDNGVGSAP